MSKDAVSKLSRQQKRLLITSLAYWEYIEANGNDLAKLELEFWGIPWHPAKRQDNWTRADSVIISRSLRRLEHRGLVERKNNISGSRLRTTMVKFTPLGLEVAKQLTKK